MLGKLFKVVFWTFVIAVGVFISLIFALDYFEEDLYKKFGKENVLNFMKRFEPFIVVTPEEEAEGSEEEAPAEEEVIDFDMTGEVPILEGDSDN